jgi:hypothetical protein
MDCSTGKGGNLKEGKNRDKKIVVVKFIIQKKKKQEKTPGTAITKVSSLLGKHSGVIPLASNHGIGTWYSGLCEERCCPTCWTAWGGDGKRVCFFFSAFLGLWALCYKQQLWCGLTR